MNKESSTRHEFARPTLAGLAAFGTGSSTVIGMSTRLALRDAVIMNGVLEKALSSQRLELMVAYARLHEHELRANWKKLKALQPLRQIAPLE